jgi:GNAT superfamily N-acetyltransferase
VPAALGLVRELAAYERAAVEVEVTEKEMEEWGFGANRVFEFFVAEKRGVVIGLALYYFKYSTWKGKCLFLEDIVVKESERCKGVGTLLMKEIIGVARAQGLRRVEWQVLDWNTPAIEFYKKYRTTFDSEWINCRLVPGNY